MYVDILHYRAVISFGVSETTSSQDEGVVTETPKPIITPIVYYVYIHNSQDKGVVSETPKPIVAR